VISSGGQKHAKGIKFFPSFDSSIALNEKTSPALTNIIIWPPSMLGLFVSTISKA
jgi:hypothetical protein